MNSMSWVRRWAYTPDDFQYIPSALDGCVIAYNTMPGSGLQDYGTVRSVCLQMFTVSVRLMA